MFEKILIANRGEIACRVIKSAQKMGIKTVAVYSEADDGARHMRLADEAIPIGPPPASESYLQIDRIVEACKATGAQAVHPGYGFLSENGRFAEALKAAGIAFIGPDVRAIGAMGDKIESKKLAAAAGVSTVPGHIGVIADDKEAIEIARGIGYPVMIKASAGGGGKGMRVAYDDDEVREGFSSAKNEARSSFGDDRIFIEKYIEEPRHIEIQVLADRHGTCLYLGERECSIQRRHQKVIEEAPSPFVDAETRRAMGEQAVALSRAVDYVSAGTVEFIVDKERNFYFLEMNTRLQVEHPVTELVTGIDLVEQMIRVAAGEKLPWSQDDIKLSGWAVESRLYAEDPYRGFLPSIGRLSRFRPLPESPTMRIDTGVAEGSEITLFYDPMIAKLITYGPDRDGAIAEMRAALDGFDIGGISHNVDFLNAVMAHPRFREGRLTTNFIAEEFPDGFQGAALSDDDYQALVAVAALVHARRLRRERSPLGVAGVFVERDWIVMEGKERETAIRLADAVGGIDVGLGDDTVELRSEWRPGQRLFEGEIDGREYRVLVDPEASGYRLTYGGAQVTLSVLRPKVAALARLMPEKAVADTAKFLLCPMPGLLVSVAVEVGQEVKTGQPLAVVEAMKMENVLRAERDGVVGTVEAKAGDTLAVDQVILTFE
ncbi:acetyl-CoA carboxylase biotin carboxylase subunit [Oceanibacterium hippocampi]|uniref:propionyl-CoA carboxylase n=1 Tax=Oceanibacterium hippocampi TaxID=745714 RepID=A0A1Y5SGZ7_9PROT|nr:acetyl/propionyl/methylcrotonyl-CoA carboxylase subunit alpha [Oceanibacterium hippocampi]SLN40571.1 Acetyl-/propionyl-coenzyme A carboxylase alpha chain [Oceanibacterium hippocampi]